LKNNSQVLEKIKKLFDSPTCAFIDIQVKKYSIVQRFQNVTEVNI
jgi:hypothetical protein